MKLHSLVATKKSAQRLGRGGKRGTTSGRGQKGQKSRAGHKIRPAFRDLISRIPKRRGVTNHPTSEMIVALNLKDLSRLSGTVDRKVLQEAGLVNPRHRGMIKVLSNGDAPKSVTFKGLLFSKMARTKVIDAGGTIQ